MERKHEELKRRVDNAFHWLDKLMVNGSAVDVLAMARQELRAMQALLQEENKNTED